MMISRSGLHYSAALVFGFILATSCFSAELLDGATPSTSTAQSEAEAAEVIEAEDESLGSTPAERLTAAIEYATQASVLAQGAQSAQDWDQIVQQWTQAIALMESIPPAVPQRVFAQRKIREYLQHLTIAQQQAATTSFPQIYPSFNSQVLDQQIVVYLSYVSAVGPPDVLIVGSSRGLQGVNPQVMEAVLATRNAEDLKVFNFGVNGATAQTVNFLLQRLLTPEQLPQLIIWADGVRAFNNGRADKTYASILDSQGYRTLLAGKRPTFPPEESAESDGSPSDSAEPPAAKPDLLDESKLRGEVEALPDSDDDQKSKVKGLHSTSSQLVGKPSSTSAGRRPKAERLPSEANIASRALIASTQRRLTLPNVILSRSVSNIDAYGFLPVFEQFDPETYYQRYPRVSGKYDADYQAFNLRGPQDRALNALATFTRNQQIPLVIVNLPLSRAYLDPDRLQRERQFQQHMQRRAQATGFIFLNLSQQWLAQDHYFADPSHINLQGATAIAQQLATHPQIPWSSLPKAKE
ncbi:MAG: hypothetical protein F6K19_18695 [Cyanothece sp. SIO1E1]|nr:hypothetical protein [Cyanothece sp. SIO1E1]